MKSTLRSGLLGILFCLGMAQQAAVQAITLTLTTYQFNGNCIDCALVNESANFPVTAQLTLFGYAPGTALTNDNFESFVYGGSNLVGAFSVTQSGDDNNASTTDFIFEGLQGNLSTLPGFNDVLIYFAPFGGDMVQLGYFYSQAGTGAWNLCNEGLSCSNDFGSNGIYSGQTGDVPVPGGFALLIAGLGAFGLVRRQSA